MLKQVDLPEGSKGPWSICRFEVTEKESEFTHLRAIIKGGRGYVKAGTYTKLVHAQRGVIMSDTKDEMRDHFHPYWLANGHVLINGFFAQS